MLRFFNPAEDYQGISSAAARLTCPLGHELGRKAKRTASKRARTAGNRFADIAVTANNVAWVSGDKETMLLGATVTAGQLVYKDTSDSDKAKLVDADSATAAAHSIYGVALGGGVSGQYIVVQTNGYITIGGTTAVGIIYCASATAGGILIGSPGTLLYTSIFGIGYSVTQIRINIFNSGSVVA